ncbi:MAG: 50S ribosomal protein L11 methyltransferase [Sphingobacteriaceae bacterium]|nr:50S ribosomal protein L11 methyltransferase [Sphingobacteriaceae bacterium]
MQYYRFDIRLEEDFKEILLAELGELAFEAFDDSEARILTAWVQKALHDAQGLAEILERYEGHIIEVKGPVEEEERNWNELWESQYEPVVIDDFVHIRAPFHPHQEGFRFELEIEPKMSFGTGHHGTTAGMVRMMQQIDMRQKRVLDMGSGTGILGIVAMKLGAKAVHAIDIEAWAVENAIENAKRNAVEMEVELGTALHMTGTYDVILANINRNIILQDIARYAVHCTAGAALLCSGFYIEDVDMIREGAALNNFKFERESNENNWATVLFTKL